MYFRIDTAAAEPIYSQIVREVQLALARGELKRGDRLPAARELAASLDVNMHTVLRAYSELRDSGDIELRRGRVAVVARDAKADRDVRSAVSNLLALARSQGVSVRELHLLLDEGDDRS